MTCNVAFIGLGVMGYPMAGYISKGGHNVTVFNRTKSKAEKWISEYKGKLAETPAEAAKDAEYVFTCVGNDNDLREVTFGDNGAFKTINKGAIYIDNTTASATIAREIYEYAKKKWIWIFRCTGIRWSSRCRKWCFNSNDWRRSRRF